MQKKREEAEQKRLAAEIEQRKNQRILQEIEQRELEEAQALLEDVDKRSKRKGGKKPILEGVSSKSNFILCSINLGNCPKDNTLCYAGESDKTNYNGKGFE